MIRSAKPRPFRVTIVHPCVGRHEGMKRYIRTWMMEPIPAESIRSVRVACGELEERYVQHLGRSPVAALPFDAAAMA